MKPTDANGGDANDAVSSHEDDAVDDQSDAAPEGRIEWRVVDGDGNDITDRYTQNIHTIELPALAGVQALHGTLQAAPVSESLVRWQEVGKTITAILDELPDYSAMLKNIYPAMRRFADACSQIASSINYDGIREAVQRFAELASRLNYIKVLEAAEWPLYLVSDERMAKEISGLDARADKEVLRARVCEIALDALGSEWAEEVHARWEGHDELSDGERALLLLALDHHGRGEYEACVSILMCLLEGFLDKYCERPNVLTEQQKDDFDSQAKKHGLNTIVSSKGKKRDLQNSKDLVLVLLVRTENGYYFWNAVTSYVVDIVLTNTKDFEAKAAHNPLRNKICHGEQTNYGTKEHSLKAILAIDIVIRLGCAARLAMDSEIDDS